jgi:hypothetical protein
MRRWWWLAVFCVGTAWGAPGRIVRIERERAAPDAGPLICDVYESLHGLCIGRMPRAGELVTIVDEGQVLAQATIAKAEHDVQRCDGLWNITVELVHGDVSQTSTDRIGVVDTSGDPRMLRKLQSSEIGGSPSGNPEETPILAIDRNGDRRGDIIVTRYPCDLAGRPSLGAPDHCLDVWTRRGPSAYVRTSQTNLTACANNRP